MRVGFSFVPVSILNTLSSPATTGNSAYALIWSQILTEVDSQGRNVFLWFNGDGQLYTFTKTGTAAYYIDRLSISAAQTPYVNAATSNSFSRPVSIGWVSGYSPGIYNRFWEFPDLGIIATVLNNEQPVWVLKLRN